MSLASGLPCGLDEILAAESPLGEAEPACFQADPGLSGDLLVNLSAQEKRDILRQQTLERHRLEEVEAMLQPDRVEDPNPEPHNYDVPSFICPLPMFAQTR